MAFSSRLASTWLRYNWSARTGGSDSAPSTRTCLFVAAPARFTTWATRSSRSQGSSSGLSAPPSIRLRSSRLRTSRPIRSASVSIAWKASRWSAGVQATDSSSMLPAAARMVASGVRRSCETESSRAVLRASPRRAISALVRSRPARSRTIAWPSWSAAAERMRVSARSGSRSSRARRAQTEPSASPDASTRTRWTVARSALRRTMAVATCIRTQRAGSLPGERCSTTCHAGTGSGCPGAVSAIVFSSVGVAPRPNHMRSIAAAAANRSSTMGAASSTVLVSTRARLMPKRAWASRALWATSSACSACRATSRPMATATARRSRRFSHSSGLLTVKV